MRLHIVCTLDLKILMILKFITLGKMLLIQRYMNSQKQVLQNNIEVDLLLFFVLPILKNSRFYLLAPMQLTLHKLLAHPVTAHKYGMLCCESSYTRQAVEKIGNDGEDIVIINNLLTSGWMNRLPEILAKKKILYIATHPYAEDIRLNPKGCMALCYHCLQSFL